MWYKLAAAVATLSIGGYTVYQVLDETGPEAAAASAQQAFTNIADAAYYDSMLVTDSWEDILRQVVNEARNNDNITVSGTTLYWRSGDFCFYADIPTPDTEPESQPCGNEPVGCTSSISFRIEEDGTVTSWCNEDVVP